MHRPYKGPLKYDFIFGKEKYPLSVFHALYAAKTFLYQKLAVEVT